MKTWFQNRRAKWRRLKQDSNDPEKTANGESTDGSEKKVKTEATSEDDNLSADDEDSAAEDSESKQKENNSEKQTPKENGFEPYSLRKLSPTAPNGLYSGSDRSSDSVSAFSNVSSAVPSPSLQPSTQSLASVSHHAPYQRLPTIGPLAQPYYQGPMAHHPSTYPSQHGGYITSHDYQSNGLAGEPSHPLPSGLSTYSASSFSTSPGLPYDHYLVQTQQNGQLSSVNQSNSVDLNGNCLPLQSSPQ